MLVVTHADKDHYNLLTGVLSGIQVDLVLLPGEADSGAVPDERPFDDYPAGDFDDWLGKHPRVVRVGPDHESAPGKPSTLFGTGRTEFYILAANVPAKTKSPNFTKNTRSIVLKVTHGRFDAVLTGDATFDTEEYILGRIAAPSSAAQPDWLDVELLKLGHHGSSATSSGDPWFARLRPEFGIASAGTDNSYGHPSRSVIQRGETHFGSAKAHPLRWGLKGGTGNLRTESGYREAFWNTASSGTIRATSRGDQEGMADVRPWRE